MIDVSVSKRASGPISASTDQLSRSFQRTYPVTTPKQCSWEQSLPTPKLKTQLSWWSSCHSSMTDLSLDTVPGNKLGTAADARNLSAGKADRSSCYWMTGQVFLNQRATIQRALLQWLLSTVTSVLHIPENTGVHIVCTCTQAHTQWQDDDNKRKSQLKMATIKYFLKIKCLTNACNVPPTSCLSPSTNMELSSKGRHTTHGIRWPWWKPSSHCPVLTCQTVFPKAITRFPVMSRHL